MLKLDVKNKKILSVLDEDARTPLSKIASRAGISKQLADYRIKNLLKDKIIEGFTIYCDLTKLGYSTFGVYLRLKNLTEQKEQEIIDSLVQHPFTKWVVACEGKWDLAFSLCAKNFLDFNSKLEEIMAKICTNVETYETNIIFSLQNFFFHLLEREDYLRGKPLRMEFSTEKLSEKIDELDIKLLQQLAKDARASLVGIANTLKVSPDVVRYRLKNLTARKIITEFKTRISFKTLGYNWYQLLLDLRNFPESEEKKFVEKLKQIPNLSYVVKCMGKWDFEIHVHAESNEEFRKILMKVRDSLTDYIISYDTMLMFSKYKSTPLPDGVVQELIKEVKK